MKLSEAIRLGAMLRPQARHAWFSYSVTEPLPQDVSSCSLAAAYEACEAGAAERYISDVAFRAKDKLAVLVQRFPVLDELDINPITKLMSHVANIIIDLNDEALWTREQIADWVKTIEKEQEAKQAAGELVAAGQE